MNKEEFKSLFEELCKSGEIKFTFNEYNDGCTYLAVCIDGECVYEDANYIINDKR